MVRCWGWDPLAGGVLDMCAYCPTSSLSLNFFCSSRVHACFAFLRCPALLVFLEGMQKKMQERGRNASVEFFAAFALVSLGSCCCSKSSCKKTRFTASTQWTPARCEDFILVCCVLLLALFAPLLFSFGVGSIFL